MATSEAANVAVRVRKSALHPGRVQVIERPYRLRYLHRGNHPVRSAEQLCRLFWLSLSRPLTPNPG